MSNLGIQWDMMPQLVRFHVESEVLQELEVRAALRELYLSTPRLIKLAVGPLFITGEVTFYSSPFLASYFEGSLSVTENIITFSLY